MKCLGICSQGFERAALSEISEITGKEASTVKAGVIFEAESNQEIAELCYRSQSLHKVVLVLGEFDFTDMLTDLEKDINNSDFGGWLKEGTFRANVFHYESLDLPAMDLAAKAGEYVINKTGIKADMENPDVIFLLYVYDNKCIYGVDFSGITLSKRDYKIYNAPSSLNASTAFCLLKMAGWKPGNVLLDPMCGSGIIPIEAALAYTNKPPHFHVKDKLAFTKFMDFDFSRVETNILENDKKLGKEANIHCADYILAALRATKNNAKVADVERVISATKIDLEWIETKYTEKSIDFIITHPPSVSKHANVKGLKKTYDELFYQAEYVLKDEGRVALITNSPDELKQAAEKNKFSLTHEQEAWQGNHHFMLLFFEKTS
ncbi:MAG: methyltransferase [Nanobdellota archaeon]